MRIRIFGASDCPKCIEVANLLDQTDNKYEFVNAVDFDNAEIMKLCEDNKVDSMPHLQLLDANGTVLAEFIEDVDTVALFRKIEQINSLN